MFKMKTLVASALAVGLLASSSSALAYSSSGQTFTKSWEKSATTTNSVINYGFNDFLIDEDYTHTKHMTRSHTAEVVNGNGTHADSNSKGNWAKIEVQHKGSTIHYYIR
ncbi:hypothetical protein OVA29_03105 [Exiguobacterium sp. SL14]|nr:hypothetical protein [Exiguobacterium sp. SL14]MCY1689923.1 hypothetical protein [Exiguobacterium sp. SL14]